MKFIVAFLAIFAFLFALARFARNPMARKSARGAMRVASYLLAALSALMTYLGFFSQEYGTFTMLMLAPVPAFAAWFCFRLGIYCALREKEWFSQT